MSSDDVTIKILKEIRDQLGKTNARLDDVRVDLGTLATRVTESELRTSTAMHEMVETNREIATLLRGGFDLRKRVEKCERDLAVLKRKVG